MFTYTNSEEFYAKHGCFHDHIVESIVFDALQKTLTIKIIAPQRHILNFICVEGFEYIGGDSWGREANGRILELNVKKAEDSKLYCHLQEQIEKWKFSCVDITKLTEVPILFSTGNVMSILCEGFDVTD